nr:hypothetical protein [Parabacteroides merdae]
VPATPVTPARTVTPAQTTQPATPVPAKEGYVADYYYALMKIPYAKVPRFIELPTHEGKHYIMFIDDIIRANLSSIFPGYVVESCYSIKISRDADI